jgi:cobalt-zinc-cadmium efflux system membrane fusion protein
MIRNHTLTVVLTLGLVLAACSKPESLGTVEAAQHAETEPAETGTISLTDQEIKEARIQTEVVSEREVAESIQLTATIQANQDRLAHVAPRVPGRIVGISSRLGDRVRAGQALASLDSLELGEAHSTYLQAESQARVAQADFERAEKLYADQIVPQKDFLRSRAEHEKARANLRAAADRLRLMGVNPSQADHAISTFPVTAPFAGTVIEKKAVLGELATPDQSLFTIADLSTVWIEANLFEKDLGKIRVGATAGVTVAAYPGEVFKGRLTYISSVMDKESRTVKGRVEVRNADGRLKPDMFATAAMDTATISKVLTVPTSAVLLLEGDHVVFVRESAGFEKRTVRLGENLGGRSVVTQGLEDGEAVVIEGAYALKARLLKSKIGDNH